MACSVELEPGFKHKALIENGLDSHSYAGLSASLSVLVGDIAPGHASETLAKPKKDLLASGDARPHFPQAAQDIKTPGMWDFPPAPTRSPLEVVSLPPAQRGDFLDNRMPTTYDFASFGLRCSPDDEFGATMRHL